MDRFLTRSSSSGNLNAKRPADDNIEVWRTPKRYASQIKQSKFDDSRNLPTTNKYQNLPVDSENDSCSKHFFNATTKIKKLGHIPPIIVDVSNRTHESIKQTVSKFTKQFHLQYRNGNKVAVICYSPEAHQAVKEGFRTDEVSFLTYTRKDEKTPKVVIKGLPAYAEKDLPDELENLGFKGASVTKLKSKNELPCPPFLVQLAEGADIVKFRQIKYLFNCVITIQKFKPSRKPGTQCFRCQDFGHSSKNCNMPPRCVKCTEMHPTSECPKKDRKESAHCCNCKEEHPANYSKCKARLVYLERLQQNTQVRKPPPLIPISRPISKFRTWANVTATNTTDGRLPKGEVPCFENPVGPEITLPITEDAATREMFEIFLVLRKLKSQISSCTSPLEKVMLVFTHLGQYI